MAVATALVLQDEEYRFYDEKDDLYVDGELQ
jgi:hypothetical protein